MHEMSICESVVRTLEEQAKVHAYSRVKAVWLEIGPLSAIEPDAMTFCFDVATKGTLAENARLEILQTEPSAWCLPCGKTVPVTNRFDPCPDCGSHQLQITGGEELKIMKMEVE